VALYKTANAIMVNSTEVDSQKTKIHSSGILTSLLMPKKHGRGCILFAISFLALTVGASIVLSILFFLNAAKIFSNIGRYAFKPTMQLIAADVSHNERTDFSNAYVKVFENIEKNGVTSIDKWTLSAMTNLAESIKDHKISRDECSTFITLVENESKSVTNKSKDKK